jgi:hypothetical protein
MREVERLCSDLGAADADRGIGSRDQERARKPARTGNTRGADARTTADVGPPICAEPVGRGRRCLAFSRARWLLSAVLPVGADIEQCRQAVPPQPARGRGASRGRQQGAPKAHRRDEEGGSCRDAGHAGTESLRTRRWRKPDSNHRSRGRPPPSMPLPVSLEGGDPRAGREEPFSWSALRRYNIRYSSQPS